MFLPAEYTLGVPGEDVKSEEVIPPSGTVKESETGGDTSSPSETGGPAAAAAASEPDQDASEPKAPNDEPAQPGAKDIDTESEAGSQMDLYHDTAVTTANPKVVEAAKHHRQEPLPKHAFYSIVVFGRDGKYLELIHIRPSLEVQQAVLACKDHWVPRMEAPSGKCFYPRCIAEPLCHQKSAQTLQMFGPAIPQTLVGTSLGSATPAAPATSSSGKISRLVESCFAFSSELV